ncbi:type II secretion system protein [Sulfurimonas sp.]|mgnify:FL=1|jgi:general secretion pathway protein G|uniref:type II secretion system protein n=1 Tax=Sulfurimonas sp. TaxID=2022749 RepID=UPI0025FB20A7|nr:type II secretion system protein [Sulfurimonas sp.]MBT5934755.1 type II secretion system protein [Sulfurimonas sp.]
MIHKKNAFTMIELVFVIVVLGILAAVAIPRLSATRTDAQISKGRADISSIRSGIMTERQSRLITGNNAFISGIVLNAGTGLFGGVLTYALSDSATAGHWTSTGNDAVGTATYNYNVAGTTVGFTYYQNETTVDGVVNRAGTFVCTSPTAAFCDELTN